MKNIAMLRRPEVERRTGKGRSTIYRDMDEGLLTRPVEIGGNAVAWPDYEIDEINLARLAGKSETEIKKLVESLHARRQVTASNSTLLDKLEAAQN